MRGLWFKASPCKKVSETLSQKKKKLRLMLHAYNPSYVGGSSGRITVQGWPWEKAKDPI